MADPPVCLDDTTGAFVLICTNPLVAVPGSAWLATPPSACLIGMGLTGTVFLWIMLPRIRRKVQPSVRLMVCVRPHIPISCTSACDVLQPLANAQPFARPQQLIASSSMPVFLTTTPIHPFFASLGGGRVLSCGRGFPGEAGVGPQGALVDQRLPARSASRSCCCSLRKAWVWALRSRSILSPGSRRGSQSKVRFCQVN